ncbi:MAG: stage II sporulation protein M [Chitinophagales bacterium]
MREPAFIKKNKDKWQRFEALLQKKERPATPDEQAALFIQITDDLSYAKTFYPKSPITEYLNTLAAQVHQSIYRNKKEENSRILQFWKYELPLIMYEVRHKLLYAFLIFSIAILIGVVSSANDATFVRLILGDDYVNMTLDNIEKGDPMGVYNHMGQMEMWVYIAWNNVRVSFLAFIFGVFFSFGTGFILLQNGIMLGAFQYFFYQKGLFLTSFLTIWIHGTLEISAIVIAGCAGFVMGNSILFPRTYSRGESFRIGAKKGLKIIVGLVPIFILAAFFEGFITRLTEMPDALKWTIILVSLAFVIWYFVIYPRQLAVKRELK